MAVVVGKWVVGDGGLLSGCGGGNGGDGGDGDGGNGGDDGGGL